MKALIIIPSCARDRAGQREQADLLRGVMDFKFFLGCANCNSGNAWGGEDEVILPVRDDYWALPQKVRAAFRWALDHSYDLVFKADRDSFIHADRLLTSLHEHYQAGHDYFALVGTPSDCCGGSAGYAVPRTATPA